MEKELKEELVLIAKRVPPSDRWALLSDPNHIYPSLTDALEGYFEEVGGLQCDFRLSPIKGELYAIDSVVVEKAPPPPPPPPKKFNMYGDW